MNNEWRCFCLREEGMGVVIGGKATKPSGANVGDDREVKLRHFASLRDAGKEQNTLYINDKDDWDIPGGWV